VRYSVLYREAPAWHVGETTDARNARGFTATPDAGHYPDDYAGKVIAVKPADHNWSKGDLSGGRRVVTLDLTNDERARLASRVMKIGTAEDAEHVTGPAVAVPPKVPFSASSACSAVQAVVTFDDRWGAVAPTLRKQFPGDGAPEAAEQEAIAGSTDGAGREAPSGAEWFVSEGRRFREVSALATMMLPRNVVHTGAGTYPVGPGKTYTVIQTAVDQLWADQGSADFSATQTLDLYDDTFNECVTLNASLEPMAEFRLRIKAASGQTGVTVSNSGLAGHTLDVNALEHVYVGGIALASAATNYYAIRGNYATGAEVDSCAVAMSNGGRGFHTLHRGYVHDTAFTDGAGAGREFVLECFASLYRRCAFVGATQYGVQANNYGGGRFEACAFSGCQKAIRLGGSRAVGREETVVRNCTFYDCTKAIVDEAGAGDEALVASVKNCIFSTTTAGDFAIYAQGLLARVESDYNCFHGYTSPCHVDGMDKSLAEWQSETDWQGNSPDAHSFEADPLLTDPGSGDFSLASGSPCLGMCPSAGVKTGINDVDFGTYHVNCGAWATGDVVAPSISNIVVSVNGLSDTVTVVAGGSPYVLALLYATDGTLRDSNTCEGSGDIVLTRAVAEVGFVIAYGCNSEEEIISDPSAPVNDVSDPTWPGNLSGIAATNQYEGDGVTVSWSAITTLRSGLTLEYRIEHQPAAGGAWTVLGVVSASPVHVDELTTDAERTFRVGARCREGGGDWVYPSDTVNATPTWLSAPTWAADTSGIAATDGDSSHEVDLTWDAATQAEGGDVGYIADYRTAAGPGDWTEAFRTNSLSGTVANLTDNIAYDFRVRAYARDTGEATITPADIATATPTALALPTAPTITNATVSGLDITVTITGDTDGNYRVRLMDALDIEEDEDGRVGPGEVTLTALGTGIRYLCAWGVINAYQTEPRPYPERLGKKSSLNGSKGR